MSPDQPTRPGVPGEQYLSAEYVIDELGVHGARRLRTLTTPKVQVLLSGILANWLVGMAAFFATMGRTVIGKYIPVFLAVTAFVAANFQHSPANLGFFSIAEAAGRGPGWDVAFSDAPPWPAGRPSP